VIAKSAVNETGARKRHPAHGVLMLLLLVFTLAALGHVAINIKKLEMGLALGQARADRTRLLEKKRRLELEIGVLKDPGRIVAIAHDKLGLRPPRTDDIIALDALGDPDRGGRQPATTQKSSGAETAAKEHP
jgi:cell division protein FtsL